MVAFSSATAERGEAQAHATATLVRAREVVTQAQAALDALK